MQDQKMMDSSGGVEEALKWLEPFASGEYVALGIPREALLEEENGPELGM